VRLLFASVVLSLQDYSLALPERRCQYLVFLSSHELRTAGCGPKHAGEKWWGRDGRYKQSSANPGGPQRSSLILWINSRV
jgi:hypothetical protein